jgi:uncharacterized delta-60 repeat protein
MKTLIVLFLLYIQHTYAGALPCKVDADCSNGWKCLNKFCVECIVDADCTGYNVCQNSACVAPVCGPNCTLSSTNITYGTYPGYYGEISIQADGKILLSTGVSCAASDTIRINNDGTLDTSWANNGSLTGVECCGGLYGAIYGHKLGINDSTFSTGVFNDNPAGFTLGDDYFISIVKIRSNGSLDTSYGVNGFAAYDAGVVSLSSYGYPKSDSLIVYSDESVIAYSQFKLYKLTPTGAIDTSWHGGVPVNLNGIDLTSKYNIVMDVDSRYTRIYKNPVNGKIYYWNKMSGPSGDRGGHLVLNPNGTLDTTYGDGGFVLIDYNLFGNTTTSCGDIPIYTFHSFLEDGSFMVAGYAVANLFMGNATCNEIYTWILKYKIDGQLNTTFGTNGLVSYGANAYGDVVKPESHVIENTCDGSLLLSIGNCAASSTYIAKFTKDGVYQSSFANRNNTYNIAIGVKPNGNVVLAYFINGNTTLESYICPLLSY